MNSLTTSKINSKLLVLLTTEQHNKFKIYAEKKGVSMGAIIRSYIQRLPNTEE